MSFLIGFIFLFLGVFFYLHNNRNFTPIVFYLLWWGFICGAAGLRLRGEKQGSFFVYFLIVVSTFAFVVGYEWIQKYKMISITEKFAIGKWMNKNNTDELNRKLVYSLGVFSVIFLLIITQRALKFYEQGYTIGIIRQIYWSVGSGIINNALEYFIAHTVVNMVFILYMCVFATQLIKQRVDKIFCVLFAIITILNVVIAGGRMALLDIVTTCFFAILMKRKEVNLTKKTKKILLTLVLLIAITVIGLTISRQGANNILTTIWSQFTVNVPFMSYLIENVVSSKDITYGYNFFRGILDLVFVFLSQIGIAAPEIQNILGQFTNPFYVIDGGITVNAYTSHIFYYYIDGRVLGVIIGSSIFGVLVGYIYKQYCIQKSNANFIRLLIIFNVIYYTFYQWKFVNSSYVLAMILAGFCFKSNNNVIEKGE